MKNNVLKFLKRYFMNSNEPITFIMLGFAMIISIFVVTGVLPFWESDLILYIILSTVPQLVITILDFKHGKVE